MLSNELGNGIQESRSLGAEWGPQWAGRGPQEKAMEVAASVSSAQDHGDPGRIASHVWVSGFPSVSWESWIQ